MDAPSWRESLSNAAAYWEPRRIIYNLALLAVVGARFYASPGAADALNFDAILVLFILAVLANIAYCAAYLPDVLLHQSSHRALWYQWRWMLLLIGTLFASAITYFFASGLFAPYVPIE